MSFFQLVIKQMRQRALSTWLTLLSVLLGVGLATAVLILYRGGGALFGQTEFGYDILIGPPKGAPLQLVMNTVYQVDQSPGVVSWAVYEDLLRNRAAVRVAVPYAMGDSYEGHRIVGTLPKLFGVGEDGQPLPPERVLEYKVGKRYQLAQGRAFHPEKFEAVVGADVPQRTGLKLGDKFRATHGLPQPGEVAAADHEHEADWTVVGVLAPTRTAADRVIFIPMISFFAIGEHGEALELQADLRERAAQRTGQPSNSASQQPPPTPRPIAPATAPTTDAHDAHDHDHGSASGTTQTVDDHDHVNPVEHHDHEHPTTAAAATSPAVDRDHAAADDHDHHDHLFHLRPDGTIDLHLPKEAWQVSSILVRSRGGPAGLGLIYNFRVIDNRAVAVNPATVMREFFDTFFHGSRTLLLAIAFLVSVVASVGILVSIYNSVSARMREIAILRALGATRTKILALICVEAALIGLLGGVLGLVAGHALGGVGSFYLNRVLGEGIDWLTVDWSELLYLAVVVVIAAVAGLVPAMKAYGVPVATNLVAE